ncbi:MAG: acyltransferase family protein [Bacteroidales bacterium]|nr:acyltransferase family protein [Bacteroidales bacterium]
MTRKVSIDIAKGTGISLVVLGHLIDYFGAGLIGTYRFIYLFHVPLFFFLSGLFFKEKEGVGDCLKKKFFRLFIPYLLANIFFFAVEMVRARLMGDAYDGNMSWSDLMYAVLGLWPVLSMLSRPTWFILILFRVFIIYKLLQLVFKGNKIMMLSVCVLAGVFGALFPIEKYMIGQTLAALPFFSLGHVCTAEIVDNQRIFSPVKCILLGSASAIALLFISRIQMTNIAVNVYGSVPLYFTGAIIGILMVISFSKLLERWTIASKSISFVGKYTLPILIWHIFVIKVLFTLVEKGLGENGGALLLVLAFFIGIMAPIGLSLGFKKMKSWMS